VDPGDHALVKALHKLRSLGEAKLRQGHVPLRVLKRKTSDQVTK
jgi:hypothetical protein